MNYSKKTTQNTNSNQSPLLTSNCLDFMSKSIIRFTKSKAKTKDLLFYVEKLNIVEREKHYLTKNVISSIEGCGSWLEFRNYTKVDKTKLHNANFCKKDKLCPACAMRRASKQVKKVMNYFEENPDFKKKHWYYIVLPVRHNAKESFETVFNRAKNGLNTLRKAINNNKQGKGHKSFFSQFEGLFYSFEVTKTENGWNNHINLLCCSDKPIKDIYSYVDRNGKKIYQHKEILHDWAKYTDNKSFMHSINKIDVGTEEELIKNLLEIFKYSMKFQDLKPKDLLEAYKSTYKKRLLGAFGSLYNIKTDVDLDGDEVLGKEFLEIIFRYNFKTKKYFEYLRQLKEVDCKDKSFGKYNYKFIDVKLRDTNQVLYKLPVKQKVTYKNLNNVFTKSSNFSQDWACFKKTMEGL